MQYLKDMTPAARARLKLYSHFAIIFVFNAVLAALVFFTNNSGPINLYTLVVAVVAQGVLALVDSLKKFFTASGEPTISAMLDAARAEITKKAPPAPVYAAPVQDFAGYINNAFQPSTTGATAAPTVAPVNPAPAAPTYSAPAQPATSGLATAAAIARPAWLQDINRQSTPAPTSAPVQGNYPPPGIQFLNTIPNLAAIQNPAQG